MALRWLSTLPWLLPWVTLLRLARRSPRLTAFPAASRGLVSVIVPARNEASTIDTVIRSILATTYPAIELIVVDDRSTDATRTLAEQAVGADPRARVLAGEPLPDGWYGKPWALEQGYRAARGDFLLFTDADTRHTPELIGRAVGAIEATAADLLTIAPRQRCVTLWERLIMPQVIYLLALRFHPRLVNRARHRSEVIAIGQFILVRRPAYEAIGGHEVVRAEIAEDLALAQEFWSAGYRLRVLFGDELIETRMYTGLRHLIEGWSKNIYLGSRRSFPDEPVQRALVPLLLGGALAFWLVPWLLLAAVAVGALPAWLAGPLWGAVGASVLFWGAIAFGMGIPPWYGLGYPVGAALSLYIVGLSTIRGARRVEWKGRRYGPDLRQR
ncbi:MAG TPA: glycosyltransferase family 2 protein [Gemmatimonadales bacterium]|nr:glycosyltransferase family 2 protein [Gemmatimonadales bacterium]